MKAPWQEPAYRSDPIKLFRWQVKAHPQRLAVRSYERSLTYAQLDKLSDRIATGIEAGPDDIVAIAAERSCEMLATLVAILKRGAAYLPLDIREPPRRRLQMIKRAKPRVIVGKDGLSLEELSERPAKTHVHQANDRHLAYVLFTSGSTGEPKGVMIERKGLMNNLASKVFDLPLRVGEGVAQTAPLAFDVSVWQLLAPLMAGARVEIMDPTDLTLLAEELVDRKIHVLELVPSQLEVLLTELEKRPRALPLRWLIPTGEALPSELCRRWFKLYPQIPLLNAYGPAECSDDVTTHILREPTEAHAVPIGEPLPHVEVHLLDDNLSPVAEGEICVTGVGVGRGYIDDPERTAASFITWNGKRLYRTGDLGRRLADGSLVYLGRSDFQIKVRGERIELGEIEAVLMSHPDVRSAVVVPWSRSANERVPLAYVVPARLELQTYLQEHLTPAMRPLIMGLDALPLNANGKVDRSRLPKPENETTIRSSSLPDRLVGIFQEFLAIRGVDEYSDFFLMGGDSLTALRLVARIETDFGIRLSPSQLVLNPTPSALAEVLSNPVLHSRLLCLHKGEGKPFLFLPGAGGHVVYLAALARCLEVPFYGLEAKGLDGIEPPAESVEEEVRYVIAALRELAPNGPYCLAGHSIGAWTAFETARILQEQGEEVSFLALVGMPAPHLVKTYGEDIDSASWLLVLSELFASFSGQVLNLNYDALRKLAPDEQLDKVGESLKKAGILPLETDRDRMRSILRVYRAHHRIRYRPTSRYDGNVMLIRTFEGGLRRPVMGWERYVSKPVEVKFVPGDHLSMMKKPHVGELATVLREGLDCP